MGSKQTFLDQALPEQLLKGVFIRVYSESVNSKTFFLTVKALIIPNNAITPLFSNLFLWGE